MFIQKTVLNIIFQNQKVYILFHEHFAEVQKVMPAFKRLDSFLHGFNVKVVLHEKVLVRSLLAPVPSVELF